MPAPLPIWVAVGSGHPPQCTVYGRADVPTVRQPACLWPAWPTVTAAAGAFAESTPGAANGAAAVSALDGLLPCRGRSAAAEPARRSCRPRPRPQRAPLLPTLAGAAHERGGGVDCRVCRHTPASAPSPSSLSFPSPPHSATRVPAGVSLLLSTAHHLHRKRAAALGGTTPVTVPFDLPYPIRPYSTSPAPRPPPPRAPPPVATTPAGAICVGG